MNRKILTKLIAGMLIMTLGLVNFILLGIYTSKTYASNEG